MFYSVKQISELTGVSVRTLHHYHNIGLLTPCHIAANGYRFYDDKNVETLYLILFYREIGYSLETIRELLSIEYRSCNQHFEKQKHLLMLKKKQIEHMLSTLDKLIEGEQIMTNKPFRMDEFKKQRDMYAEETKERYGTSDAYKESMQKTASYKKEEWALAHKEAERIFQAFADALAEGVAPEAATPLVEEWKKHITTFYYTCTDEILAGLGEMYVADERFMQNIDQYGDGVAAYMSRAIGCYV